MSTKRVVFVGALENGKTVLECLLSSPLVHVVQAFTYEDDIQWRKPLGTVFDDIYPGINKVRKLTRDDVRAIESSSPDYIFVAGWSHILDPVLLQAAKEGCIGFHPARLPKDRGRSVLAWQISEGYTETALTMFYLTAEVDAGDIIAQQSIVIDEDDYIVDVLRKVTKATFDIMVTYLPLLGKKVAPRIPQDHGQATYRRLRTEEDQRIAWDRPVREIHNLVRAIAPPYPCARTFFQGRPIRVLRGRIVRDLPEKYWFDVEPGTILNFWHNGEIWVKARDGVYAVVPEFMPALRANEKRSFRFE
ncbi:MAG TPA: formyl transferase [Desulfotomaculum sp.]|nr:formyl transferase [Desulfotomaculum sp.]